VTQFDRNTNRLTPEARRRLWLIAEIRRVADEIDYQGHGDTERLGRALDERLITPLRASVPSWKGYRTANRCACAANAVLMGRAHVLKANQSTVARLPPMLPTLPTMLPTPNRRYPRSYPRT